MGHRTRAIWSLLYRELNNIPACADEQEDLAVGDRVVFLPEHVISIYSRGGAEVTVDDEDQA